MKSKICFALLVFACAVAFQSKAHNEAVTFNRDIAPLVFEHCAVCHHAGGSAPFALTTYAEVKQRARQIAEVTATRYMPPWLPEPNHLAFANERRLSDAQIKLIQQWAATNAPEGNAKDLLATPRFNDAWQLGQPDLIVKMNEGFILPASGGDVFRNFVLPLPVTATKFVKAVEILPSNPKVVHHANLLIDRSHTARQLDKAEAGPGFAGMQVDLASDSFDPDSHFLFWKPGAPPAVEPDGMAWRCEPDTDLVLNLHLFPSGKPERVAVEVGLYFSDKPQTIFPMLLQLEHDGALDIPAGKADFTLTDELTLPVDVNALGVYPHAHYLGQDLLATATLPNGEKKTLVHITRWDLSWQGVYQFRAPVFLPQGTVVSMRYVYDNSAANPRNPHAPPRRVRAGNRSSEEMGHLWLQVLPQPAEVNGIDARLALQEALMRRRLQKYPADFTAHFNLAAALQTAGRDGEAIPHFQRALQTRPNDPVALTGLGASLQAMLRRDEAVRAYRQALRARPDYGNARYNLGNLLGQMGYVKEAVIELREFVKLQPNDAAGRNSLGSALAMSGQLTEAAVQFRAMTRLQPDSDEAFTNLAAVLAQQNLSTEAITNYQTALRLNPRNAAAHNELGVLLARQNKFAEALNHFEQAVKLDPANLSAKENLQKARALRK
jgi:Flp pilus assembly protein TadD/mono/diheme cytochrome c family protein